MLEKTYEELKQNINIRENLSLLRGQIKDDKLRTWLLDKVGDGRFLTGFLEHEEPKVRKNAALLIGDLRLEEAAGSLFCAYEKENTLFVKSAYLLALGKLDASAYLIPLKEHQAALLALEVPENEKKHIREELRELEKIIVGMEGIKRHTFVGFEKAQDILLTTNREQRNVTMTEVGEMSVEVRRSVNMHPLGVLVHTRDVWAFTKLRTYRELLFPIQGKIGTEPREAAAIIWHSNMPKVLWESHKEDAPFYFRLEMKSRMALDKKSVYAKRFSIELERLSGRKFINSTKNYELEIRLIEMRDGGFMAFYKLFTIPMNRFSYRKNAIASSIHPAAAAMLIELAKPYLKEHAQILDPFCGVGTMLIERDIRVPAREKYGIDIFGDAICMARENASAAGEQIHFINRDYFDFKHEYLFDEIITNMPARSIVKSGGKSKEEMSSFYEKFFDKSMEILKSGGIIVMYSNEEGFVKKQIRLREHYRLLQEYCIREKDHFYLFIIQYKK